MVWLPFHNVKFGEAVSGSSETVYIEIVGGESKMDRRSSGLYLIAVASGHRGKRLYPRGQHSDLRFEQAWKTLDVVAKGGCGL